MLKGIPVDITPDLYSILYNMGHGDELTITDANFPAMANTSRLYVDAETDSTKMLDLVLSYFPIDTFENCSVFYMSVADGDSYKPDIWYEFDRLVEKHEDRPLHVSYLTRTEFYQRAKASFAIIATGEKRRYGNIIIKKGIIEFGI